MVKHWNSIVLKDYKVWVEVFQPVNPYGSRFCLSALMPGENLSSVKGRIMDRVWLWMEKYLPSQEWHDF